MNKIEIEVPKEIRYISEWNDFDTTLLQGHSIINKTITGCGFTHYSLTNGIPTILCSPRKFLLENKHIQLPNTYLVINSGEKSLDIDGDEVESRDSLKKIEDPALGINKDLDIISSLKSSLISYLLNCKISNQAPKILVTYDSLKYVIEVLEKELQYYSIIVDEFQNIFMDSRFKAETELNFVSVLQDCPNVTYLSATPYIEEYLEELDEFKNLPYYELKWHPDRLQTIKIDPRKVYNISKEVDNIISDYLSSRFPEKVCEKVGEIHQSKEVVFYVNSVKMICNIIKRNGLTQDNTNIICADTEKNKKSLKKIGFTVGTAPLKGQPHKMFTFCTRTTYSGADFYSTSAISVIISDCKINTLSTDIRMDFPQIMGRQRLKENVFRDECIFIYKLSDETITMDQFNTLSLMKLKASESDLANFSAVYQKLLNGDEVVDIKAMLSDYRLRIKIKKYGQDYTGIDEKTGQPKINKLVMISERRAFELRSNVYKNDVLVYNEFANSLSVMSFEDSIKKKEKLDQLKNFYYSSKSFYDNMKLICEILLDSKWNGYIHISDFYWLPLSYRNYLNYPGPERIRANGYKEASILKEINQSNVSNSEDNQIVGELLNIFIVGNRYSLKEAKEMIGDIYKKLGIKQNPKASDLEKYFNLREIKINDPILNKRIAGYEILGLKE